MTTQGGFLESVTDRYPDLVVFAGLTSYFSGLDTPEARPLPLIPCLLCVTGSVLPSCVRARSEELIGSCNVAFVERGERTVAGGPRSDRLRFLKLLRAAARPWKGVPGNDGPWTLCQEWMTQ
ncbi:MAG: hypothetical protein P8188_13570 [Gemmatimonadota bacterium]